MYTTKPRYVNVSFGLLHTGCRNTNYNVSIDNIKSSYEWEIGKYITHLEIYNALKFLGFYFVQGLPLRNTGVYAEWKKEIYKI